MRFKLAARLSLVLPVALLASSAYAAPQPKEPPKVAQSAGVSYVVCYFGGPSHWRWGLAPDNAYFSMSGEWITTPITKTEKFSTTESVSNIVKACAKAKEYYKEPGELFAACAATSSIGKSYAIVSNGEQMFPLRC